MHNRDGRCNEKHVCRPRWEPWEKNAKQLLPEERHGYSLGFSDGGVSVVDVAVAEARKS